MIESPLTNPALLKLFGSATGQTMGTSDRRRLEDTVVALRAVLLAQPDYRPALHQLGVVLHRLGRVAEAEAVLRTAIERHPEAPELLLAFAEVLADWNEIKESIEAAEAAARLMPGEAEPLTLIARLREAQGEPAMARAALEAAASTGRPNAPALIALGRLQRQSGEVDLALFTLTRAIESATDPAEKAAAHVQHALALLSHGRIAEGFREYDWRWKTGLLPGLNPGLPPWTGDRLGGRMLLVRCEQGMSECLQFFRLAGLITGGRVVVEAPPALVPLLRASHRVADVIAQGDRLPRADCWAPLLSLPRLMRIDANTIPDAVPYLRPDPSLFAPWRQRLVPGPKIGIAWRGGEPLFENRRRSIPLAAFAPLSRIEGVHLVSLQKGEGRQEIDAVPFPIHDPSEEMDEGEGAFLDTAVVMQECALIVTADTAIAHLAGALARPVWTVLPEGGDWRLGWHPSDSPWYPTMECLRRPPGGRWKDVFEHIARRLVALKSGRIEGEAEEENG